VAINLELMQSAGLGRIPGDKAQVLQHPLVAFTNIVAAGAVALDSSSEIFSVRNRVGGDSVYVRVQLATDSTTASASNATLLTGGDQLDFALPAGALGSAYEIDVRAA
jgi:hypothetical protein